MNIGYTILPTENQTYTLVNEKYTCNSLRRFKYETKHVLHYLYTAVSSFLESSLISFVVDRIITIYKFFRSKPNVYTIYNNTEKILIVYSKKKRNVTYKNEHNTKGPNGS